MVNLPNWVNQLIEREVPSAGIEPAAPAFSCRKGTSPSSFFLNPHENSSVLSCKHVTYFRDTVALRTVRLWFYLYGKETKIAKTRI